MTKKITYYVVRLFFKNFMKMSICEFFIQENYYIYNIELSGLHCMYLIIIRVLVLS